MVTSITLFLTVTSNHLMRSIGLQADMGGAGFIFTGENDADIMHNSVTINLNVLECQRKMNEAKGKNNTKFLLRICLHVS